VSLVPIIDVSRHQGAIDFKVMAARGVVGVIIRLGNGSKLDDRAAQYVPAAKAAGLVVGGYWFINPKQDSSGAAQMARFLARARQLDVFDLPLMMDVESYLREPGNLPVITGPALHAWLCEGADYLEAHDRTPLVYSNRAYFDSQGMVAGPLARCPIIVARYPWYSPGHPTVPANAADWEAFVFEGTTKRPQVPVGWPTWHGWQFSAGYNRAGATFGVSSDDLDLNLIKPEAWAAWCGRPAPSSPPSGGKPDDVADVVAPPIVVRPSPSTAGIAGNRKDTAMIVLEFGRPLVDTWYNEVALIPTAEGMTLEQVAGGLSAAAPAADAPRVEVSEDVVEALLTPRDKFTRAGTPGGGVRTVGPSPYVPGGQAPNEVLHALWLAAAA
jgi:GH25 family lysozyme M1 (1,4-beta-N-acetylmuramidase)